MEEAVDERFGVRRAHTKSLVLALACGVLGAVFAFACLPDLAPIPAELTQVTATACGDGLIAGPGGPGVPDGGESCDPGDASIRGCLDCQVTCPEGELDTQTDHCYFVALSGAEASALAAVTVCQSAGAHVVTIGSDDEAARASKLAEGAGYWVGLTFNGLVGAYTTRDAPVPLGLEPGWPQPTATGPCSGCFGFGRDGGGFDSFDDAEVPEAGPPVNQCVGAFGSSWRGAPCDTPLAKTICEREPPGHRYQSCGGGFCFTVPPTATTKSYLLVVSEDTADDAASTCGALPGGHLLLLDSAEERAAIVRVLFDIFADLETGEARTFWIGASSDAGVWQWDDGKSRPVPWGDRQPPELATEYAFLRIGQVWDSGLVYASASKGERRPYVCERAP